MMEHTREPWKTVYRGKEGALDIDAKGKDGWPGDATLALGIGEYNARRIVACVNACAGLSTEELNGADLIEILTRFKDAEIKRDQLQSDIATIEQESRQMRARMERLERERDELLTALEQTNKCLISALTSGSVKASEAAKALDMLDKALAKVKGSM